MAEEEQSIDLETWRYMASPFFEVTPADPSRTFEAHADSQKLGQLILIDVSFSGALYYRDPALFRQYDDNYFLLECYSRGSNRGRIGDIDTWLDTHSLHILDMSRPYRTLTTDAACRSVVIPYEAIGCQSDRNCGYARLETASPRGKILSAALEALFDANDPAERTEADALAEIFTSLVRQLLLNLSEDKTQKSTKRGIYLLARRHIDRNLTGDDFELSRLCSEIGISRATLYRMFEADGGIVRYINDRRLDRCMADLRHGPARRGRVREVAERYGFFDSANFNRAFRARFGLAPSDCLDRLNARTTNPEAGAGKSPLAIVDWMRRV